MAKDGSHRGGARPGAGRKKKPLAEKLAEGKSAKVMMAPAELEMVDMSEISEFMTDMQRDGSTLHARDVYEGTYKWLTAWGCASHVSKELVEQYAMSVARWIHCEETVSRTGYIAKHPTTGAPIASPYVGMSQTYMKQALTIWAQIFQVVKENSSSEYEGPTPQDDAMEILLRARMGGKV